MSYLDASVRACLHQPQCPSFESHDREAAHTVASHPEQGWSLLCNGIVLFEDTGEILPNGTTISPHRCRSECELSCGTKSLGTAQIA